MLFDLLGNVILPNPHGIYALTYRAIVNFYPTTTGVKLRIVEGRKPIYRKGMLKLVEKIYGLGILLFKFIWPHQHFLLMEEKEEGGLFLSKRKMPFLI